MAVCILSSATCTRADSRMPGLFDAVDRVGFRRVTATSALCRTCLVARRVASLGDSLDPGMLVDTWLRLVKDSAGNYWVSQPHSVKVFDSGGTFIREVGRAGSGPLEFRMPLPIHTDGAGRVHILDAHQRETIVARDFRYDSDRLFPGRPNDVLSLPDGRYVANMWVASAERIGLPLHVVAGGEITNSFGVNEQDASPLTALAATRLLAVDGAGHIFASRLHDLKVDVWSPSGERLAGLEGSPLNTDPVLPGPLTERNPPPARVWALRIDAQQRLWVITWHPKRGWRDAMKTVVDRQGQVRLDMKDAGTPVQALFDCRVEVIDLNSLAVVGRYEGPPMFLSFLGNDGLTVSQEFAADGTMRLGNSRPRDCFKALLPSTAVSCCSTRGGDYSR